MAEISGLGYVLVARRTPLVVMERSPFFDGTFPNGLMAEIAIVDPSSDCIYWK